jgi:cobalamin-dependent methionine synthase I
LSQWCLRLAEAFAEKLHQIVRMELWGYSPDEDLSSDDLLKVKYQVTAPVLLLHPASIAQSSSSKL